VEGRGEWLKMEGRSKKFVFFYTWIHGTRYRPGTQMTFVLVGKGVDLQK